MSAADGGGPLARLSLNQITVAELSVDEVVERCAATGIGHVALWRHKLAESGVQRARRACDAAGLGVSSVCRGGFFTEHLPPGEPACADRLAENRRAVDDAAALGAEVLVLVCGGAGLARAGGLASARERVADGLAALAPYAAERGVRLAIEPLHPMYCADRSVVVTLDQALALAAPFAPEHVGVIVDAFHVWWDPAVLDAIAAARGRIAGFHVCDWLLDPPDMLEGRGMMGDGAIELRALREAVDAAGYDGPIEVEILNRDLWHEPGDEVVARVAERFAACVA